MRSPLMCRCTSTLGVGPEQPSTFAPRMSHVVPTLPAISRAGHGEYACLLEGLGPLFAKCVNTPCRPQQHRTRQFLTSKVSRYADCLLRLSSVSCIANGFLVKIRLVTQEREESARERRHHNRKSTYTFG